MTLRPFTFSKDIIRDLKLLDFTPGWVFFGELRTHEANRNCARGRYDVKDIDHMSLRLPDGDYRLYNREGYFEWLWDFEKTGKHRDNTKDDEPLAMFTTEREWVGYSLSEHHDAPSEYNVWEPMIEKYQMYSLDRLWEVKNKHQREKDKADMSEWDF